MTEETELKLRIPEAVLPRLRRSPVLSALRQHRGSRRRLLTVYFDTPSLALAKKGVSLRVRHIGGRKVQGVKLAGDADGGTVVRRPELEAEIKGDAPEIARIPDEAVRRLVSETAGAEPLAPAFVSEFGRTVWPVKLRDSEIEVALDVGEIRAGAGRALPVSELELELKSGRADRLIELALALGRSVPISVERHSKAERGFALVTGHGPKPVYADPAELDPDATARDAFVALARKCLSQLGGNEPAVLAGDPEGIHQMRVAARRLRALLACFQDLLTIPVADKFKEELRWLMGALGLARDLDVFVAETLAPMLEWLPEEAGLKALHVAARDAVGRAHAEAGAAIAAPRYTEFLLTADLRLASGAWSSGNAHLDSPVRLLAQKMLQRRYRKLVKLGSGHHDLEIEQLHQIRIAAKKMRYAAEFFRSLYSRKLARRYLGRLARLQERLGTLNDAVTGRRLLEELLPESGLDPAAAARIAGLVLGWKAARVHTNIAAFASEWERLREMRPFWVGR